MRSSRRVVVALLAGSLFGALGACAPEIGDECETSTDCSVNGDRFCDVAQPGGYCTVIGCDPDTCPDDALCVEWRYEPTRSAQTWCMASCGKTSDCDRGLGRDDRGSSYLCLRESDERLIDPIDGPLARVIDLSVSRDETGLSTAGFCTAAANIVVPEEGSDGGAIDAGATDAGATDAGATDAGATDGGTTDGGTG
jgi:hypothetical protein